ncbi:hypothetical protein KIN20_011986 [Parelaphostrongylus tenuis]|uniref:Uncharacterized protein n=1 Tax=Parelaphostrongylus tenuis TaxID=148309 RepID=A0AAD5QK58_PARTN|nr:hypothetical protein KIN20_011986 [Parelaphostrongylus tenuis]
MVYKSQKDYVVWFTCSDAQKKKPVWKWRKKKSSSRTLRRRSYQSRSRRSRRYNRQRESLLLFVCCVRRNVIVAAEFSASSCFHKHGAVEGAQVSPEDADRAADDRDANRLAGVQEEVEEDCVLAESAAKSVAEDARDEGFQGEALWANSQRLDSGNFLMSSLTNSYLTLLVYTINKLCLNSFLK